MDGVLLRHRSSWRYCQEAIGCDCTHLYNAFTGDFFYDKDLNNSVMEKMVGHGFNQGKLNELARNAPQMKGIGEVMEALSARHGSSFIISGGIGAFARELVRFYRFNGYYSNELIFETNHQLPRWEIGVSYHGKGKVVKHIQTLLGITKEETIAVGDNTNDRTMFAEAGLSISFNGNNEAMSAANYHVESDDLADILPIIYGQTNRCSDSCFPDPCQSTRVVNDILSGSELSDQRMKATTEIFSK